MGPVFLMIVLGEARKDDSDDEGDGSDKGADEKSGGGDDFMEETTGPDVNDGSDQDVGVIPDNEANNEIGDGAGTTKVDGDSHLSGSCSDEDSETPEEVEETDDSVADDLDREVEGGGEPSSLDEQPPVLLPLAEGGWGTLAVG